MDGNWLYYPYLFYCSLIFDFCALCFGIGKLFYEVVFFVIQTLPSEKRLSLPSAFSSTSTSSTWKISPSIQILKFWNSSPSIFFRKFCNWVFQEWFSLRWRGLLSVALHIVLFLWSIIFLTMALSTNERTSIPTEIEKVFLNINTGLRCYNVILCQIKRLTFSFPVTFISNYSCLFWFYATPLLAYFFGVGLTSCKTRDSYQVLSKFVG